MDPNVFGRTKINQFVFPKLTRYKASLSLSLSREKQFLYKIKDAQYKAFQ